LDPVAACGSDRLGGGPPGVRGIVGDHRAAQI